PYKFAYHIWEKINIQMKYYNGFNFTDVCFKCIQITPTFLCFRQYFQSLDQNISFRLSYLDFCDNVEDLNNCNSV
ncbi:hypothetical protein IMG5_172990, partial [Ichthyophthirius multifiliis]